MDRRTDRQMDRHTSIDSNLPWLTIFYEVIGGEIQLWVAKQNILYSQILKITATIRRFFSLKNVPKFTFLFFSSWELFCKLSCKTTAISVKFETFFRGYENWYSSSLTSRQWKNHKSADRTWTRPPHSANQRSSDRWTDFLQKVYNLLVSISIDFH